jgi:subtilisin family serine protease
MLMNKRAISALGAFALFFTPTVFAESYVVMAKGKSFDKNFVKKIESAGGTVRHMMNQVGIAVVDSDATDFLSKAESIRGVRSAVHNISLQFVKPMASDAVEFGVVEPPFTDDDDIYFDLQWGHDAIDAQDAWAKGHRGAGVRVAVLDSGIASTHPDIAPNLNMALSTSFVPGEGVDVGEGFFFNHGTHVAGTIAAADNGVGTIGVAPEAEIVAVKVLSQYTGSGGFGGIFAGMVYAVMIDADVINMSLGADVPRNCTFIDEETSELVHYPARDCAELFVAGNRIANFARQQGTLIIVAAGNDARDLNHDASLKVFPAELPGAVSISSTAPVGWAVDPSTDLDNPSSFSNFGTSGITFAAPGGDFVYPGNEDCVVAGLSRPCWVFDMVYSTIPGGWSWSPGTSMAAPHAAGVAALIIGANGSPMKPSDVVRAMKFGADDLGKPGKDAAYGHGRVNANNSTP